MIDLDKLERLERQATPGPWQADTVWDNEHKLAEAFCMGPVHEVRREGASAFRAAEKDAELMTSLRNAAPALIAELRAARKRIAELEGGDQRDIKRDPPPPHPRDEMTSKKTPIEKRGNSLIIHETPSGDRTVIAIPVSTFLSVETGVEIRPSPAYTITVVGWTLDEILDLIEGPEPVKRAVPAEVEFDAEEITRIVDAAVDRIIKEHFPDIDKTTLHKTHGLLELQQEAHDLSCEKGWWDGYDRDDQGRLKLSTDQVLSKIALIHAELSEAVEEARKSPNYSEVYYDSSKPEGFAVELADALIRILDLFGALGIDAADIVRIKHEYNKTRPVRHGGKLA